MCAHRTSLLGGGALLALACVLPDTVFFVFIFVCVCSEGSQRFLLKVLEAYELEGTASSSGAAAVAARVVASVVRHPTLALSASVSRLAAVRQSQSLTVRVFVSPASLTPPRQVLFLPSTDRTGWRCALLVPGPKPGQRRDAQARCRTADGAAVRHPQRRGAAIRRQRRVFRHHWYEASRRLCVLVEASILPTAVCEQWF